MSREEEFFELKKEYESIQPPEELLERMQASMNDARAAVQRRKVVSIVRNTAIGAAAAAAVFVLPNSDSNVATAMGNIPLIGGLIRVVTVRNYDIQDEDTDIDVKVPELQVAEEDEKQETADPKEEKDQEEKTDIEQEQETEQDVDTAEPDVTESAGEVNSKTDEYINRLLAEYYKGKGSGDKVGIVSKNWVVTDDDDWFTLGLFTTVSKADTTETERYYHIDKNTGKVATIADAFVDGADYIGIINKQIEHEIAQNPGRFFTKEDAKKYGDDCFTTITADQNFYFDSKGNMVIVFDECTIAPASEGIIRFTINAGSLKDILKYSVIRDRQGSTSGTTTDGAVTTTTGSAAETSSGSDSSSGNDSSSTTGSTSTGTATETTESSTDSGKEEEPQIEVTVASEPEEEIEVGVDEDYESDIDTGSVVEEVVVEEETEIVPRRPEGMSRPVTNAAVAAVTTNASADIVVEAEAE